jgi:hypothetical protein
MISRRVFILLCLFVSTVFSQQAKRIELGSLQNGARVLFVTDEKGEWGIEASIGNSLLIKQAKPAQFEIYKGEENVNQVSAAYSSVRKENKSIIAEAKVSNDSKAGFTLEDKWSISGNVLMLNRKVKVTGTLENAGFYSAVSLTIEPNVKWEDADYLAPGIIYGEPHTNPGALGGSLYYNAKRFSIREDYLAAPMFGIFFHNGNWITVLDPTPNGSTTMNETTAQASTPIIDDQIQFGAFETKEVSGKGIEIGFRLPGTTNEFSGGFFGGGQRTANNTPFIRRRYHPVKEGFSQSYQVSFRFGKSKTFREMQRETWRWAWETLNPKITPVNVEVMRTALIDHLADRVLVYDNRAGIPFVIDAVSGKPGSFRPALRQFRMPNSPTNQNKELFAWARTIGIDIDTTAAELDIWPKIVIGFCGKNIEVAQQLLLESDRDKGPRGQRMRKLGEMILSSLMRIVPVAPPSGEGFDIRTGKAGAVHSGTGFSVRSWAEDMRSMVDLIRQERAQGRDHADWLKWVKSYTDWLLTQQREDGSFPMTWQDSTGSVKEGTSGVTSYAAVPLLVKMSEETKDKKYLSSAIRAAEYIWTNFGSKCVFLGATGTATVADKESGMLSTEAFLALYENTKEKKWLEYAKTAGDYTESWIWIWNVPMPIGAKYEDLGWKPGVPTVGVNGIGSNDIGGVDQYLDWAVPTYAKLYKYTNDKHYLDVAKILLHGTKAMLALPGRTYDLKGPGWQQEHWRMGPIRGIGAHRTWLPWISINHLHGITGLEEFDSTLYKQLSE